MIRDEGSLLLRSVLWGIGLAALYDVLRILRGVIRHRQGVRSLEDLAYWCFTACSLFWLLFSGNNGTVRWYILAGAGAGAWLPDSFRFIGERFGNEKRQEDGK